MLSRNKIYSKIEANRDAKKIFIFCEGDKEVNYFKFFRGFSSNIDIIPIPNDDGKSDPEKLYEYATLSIIGNGHDRPKLIFDRDLGDEVWFVIDTDRWNEGNKINNVKEKCFTQINWFVVQSNPCFEIWLYFHFHNTPPNIDEINACLSFKEFVNTKINGGFNPNKHPLNFQTAAVNSEANFESENEQPKYLSTDVFRLAQSILPFIKDVIDSCIKFKQPISD